jgi:hypothetical protein
VIQRKVFPDLSRKCEALIGQLNNLTIGSEVEYDRLNKETRKISRELRWTLANDSASPKEAGELMRRLSEAFHGAIVRRD